MLLLFAAAPVVLIFPTPIVAAVAAFGIVGISQTMFGALWNTAVSRAVPRETPGRVSAWDGLGSFAMRPLGQALGGAMAGVVGTTPVLWVSAGIFVVMPCLLLTLADIRAPMALLEKRLEIDPEVYTQANGLPELAARTAR
jgi:MFS family permease